MISDHRDHLFHIFIYVSGTISRSIESGHKRITNSIVALQNGRRKKLPSGMITHEEVKAMINHTDQGRGYWPVRRSGYGRWKNRHEKIAADWFESVHCTVDRSASNEGWPRWRSMRRRTRKTLELMDLIQREPRVFEILKAAAGAKSG